MSSSPFGCNKKNSFASSLSKAKEAAAPEPVMLIADKSQVITAVIPFNTKNAAPIRQHMHQNVTENGQKIFIYRNINGWTNISLESTESAPKLTCDPITTLTTAWREFTNCAAVSKVTIKWAGSATELGFDDIKGMETQFDPLPEAAAEESGASSSKTDAEILYDLIGALDKKVDELSTKLEDANVKLVHIVGAVDRLMSAESEIGSPETSSASGKRRAR